MTIHAYQPIDPEQAPIRRWKCPTCKRWALAPWGRECPDCHIARKLYTIITGHEPENPE